MVLLPSVGVFLLPYPGPCPISDWPIHPEGRARGTGRNNVTLKPLAYRKEGILGLRDRNARDGWPCSLTTLRLHLSEDESGNDCYNQCAANLSRDAGERCFHCTEHVDLHGGEPSVTGQVGVVMAPGSRVSTITGLVWPMRSLVVLNWSQGPQEQNWWGITLRYYLICGAGTLQGWWAEPDLSHHDGENMVERSKPSCNSQTQCFLLEQKPGDVGWVPYDCMSSSQPPPKGSSTTDLVAVSPRQGTPPVAKRDDLRRDLAVCTPG